MAIKFSFAPSICPKKKKNTSLSASVLPINKNKINLIDHNRMSDELSSCFFELQVIGASCS